MIVRIGRVFLCGLGAPALCCVHQDRYRIQGFGRLVLGGNAIAGLLLQLQA